MSLPTTGRDERPARPLHLPAVAFFCRLAAVRGAVLFSRPMSTVVEIEAFVPQLSVEELLELEQFIHKARLAKEAQPAPVPSREVRMISHRFGVNPAIDLNKLGQISEDF